MIGEPTIADAILDRIVHNAHRIDLKGDSLRRKDQNKNLTQLKNSETMQAEDQPCPNCPGFSVIAVR